MANLPGFWRGSYLDMKQSPERAMARMQREMDQMFEAFWSGNWSTGMTEFDRAATRPLYRVEDKGSHFLLAMDVPGFTRGDLKVEVRGDQLHIHGEKEHGEKNDQYLESSFGSIEQWLTLPANTKAESVEAHVEHGVLRIAIPKTEASQAKEIKIGEGRTGIFAKLLERKEKAA